MLKPLLLLLTFLFITFHSIDRRKLVGKWQLQEFYILDENKEKQKIDLEKYSDCEKRSYLEITENSFKSVTFSTFYAKKVWCFKDIKQNGYTLEYDFKKDTYIIESGVMGSRISLTIVALNDSILQLEDRDSFKQYKRVKKTL